MSNFGFGFARADKMKNSVSRIWGFLKGSRSGREIAGLYLAMLAAHAVGDFLLQTQYMVEHKLEDPGVRARHVTVYTAAFVPVAFLFRANTRRAALFLALVWTTHFVTDSRRWAPGDEWPALPIVVDQAIHLATLVLLGRLLVGGGRLGEHKPR